MRCYEPLPSWNELRQPHGRSQFSLVRSPQILHFPWFPGLIFMSFRSYFYHIFCIPVPGPRGEVANFRALVRWRSCSSWTLAKIASFLGRSFGCVEVGEMGNSWERGNRGRNIGNDGEKRFRNQVITRYFDGLIIAAKFSDA